MISLKIQRKLLAQAKENLAGFGLDFTQLDKGRVEFEADEITAEVIFTHLRTGQETILSSIWFDKKTGQILQCGTNYGQLTL